MAAIIFPVVRRRSVCATYQYGDLLLLKLIKAMNKLLTCFFCVCKTLFSASTWSMQLGSFQEPFCSSTNKLFVSAQSLILAFSPEVYNLETTDANVIPLVFNSTRGSATLFFGVGLTIPFCQHSGTLPVLKHVLNNVCKKSLDVGFLITSRGILSMPCAFPVFFLF